MPPHENPVDDELTLAELEAEMAESLPERALMSTFTVTGVGAVGNTIGDLLGSLQGTSLLNVDVNLDLALDLAAPISAAVAANANAALPIDAAVTANVLSPDAVALATADQNSLLQQMLLGNAIATSNQDSAISQGETGAGGDLVGSATETGGAPAGTPVGELLPRP